MLNYQLGGEKLHSISVLHVRFPSLSFSCFVQISNGDAYFAYDFI